MTNIATFTNEQLIAVCRADVAEMSKFLKEGEFSNPSRAALYLRITEIALAALMTESAFDRDQVRREHADWSQATFGNVGPAGPLKHLSKEALEAAAEPGDLSEWADMQFLLWDAQRRAGITDEQITQAMIEKLAVNKARQWPDPKDGEPRLHVRSEEESLNARRHRNRESNARARERETPTQRKVRLEKNRARMALRRKGGAK
ncbi:TPA: DUF550 domain-containing protein [Raoultella ornithinolytica CD1_MRS_4]|nr:DUF550 domain-containing protein [Raoultella ornithinolytica]HDX8328477.1 DUF550 domain-containing protein [Raoultella ornithinolytica CD1_MRS_4]